MPSASDSSGATSFLATGSAQPATSTTPSQVPPPLIAPLALLLLEQRKHWLNEQRMLVEAYVARFPTLKTDTDGLLDLIYNEVMLRGQRGEVPTLEEYVGRFPELADQLRIQFQIDRAIDSDDVLFSLVKNGTQPLCPHDDS